MTAIFKMPSLKRLDALNAPRWKAQAAEAKAQLAEAAGRLERTFITKRQDHNIVAQNMNGLNHMENQRLCDDSECKENILTVTATAESKYRAVLEENSLLSAELKSLRETLGELKRDVAESKACVAQAENVTRQRTNELKLAREEIEKLKIINAETESALASQHQENEIIRLANKQLLKATESSAKESKDISRLKENAKSMECKMVAEVESLKVVLDMKMSELSDLRKKCEEYQHVADQLPSALQRELTLSANVEDLRTQLNHKSEEVTTLKQKLRLLEESFSREAAAKNRLSQYNEELKYKLQHKSEVFAYLARVRCEQNSPQYRRCDSADKIPSNQTYPSKSFVRGQPLATASFNEKFLSLANVPDRRGEWRRNLRRPTRSESNEINEKNQSSESILGDDLSAPNSPKIKGVVEKNDSVSYVLEIEESPEEIASRLVKKAGWMNSSSTCREAVKRQRSRGRVSLPAMPHSLAQSASASSLEPMNLHSGSAHCKLFRSNSIENNDYEPRRSLRTSTPRKNGNRRELRPLKSPGYQYLDNSMIEHRQSFSDENIDSNGDLQNQFEADTSLTNGDLVLLQECDVIPKDSAGEALISGANSEDDSSSLDERSNSSSDSECDKYININGCSERLADPVLQKIAETLDRNLSATPMDISWSDDGVTGAPDNDI